MKQFKHALLFTAGILFLTAAVRMGHAIDHPGLFNPIAAPVTQQQIVFNLNHVPAGQHWSLALEPQSSIADFTVAPGYARVWDTMQDSTMPADAFGRLALTAWSVSDSRFDLNANTPTPASVWIVSHIPANKTISVYQDGKLVYHGNISANTLLVDGNQVADSSSDIAPRAIAMLLNPLLISDEFGPSLTRNSNGAWVASTAELRRHLQYLPPITAPLQGQTFQVGNGRGAVVMAEVVINPDGKVSSVQVLAGGGSGPMADAARQALLQAQFTPFSYNGAPVTVEGQVQYSMTYGEQSPHVSIASR
jgi:TonB family protein